MRERGVGMRGCVVRSRWSEYFCSDEERRELRVIVHRGEENEFEYRRANRWRNAH